MLLSDAHQVNLNQTGPPAWSNSPIAIKARVANSVAEMRRIEIAPSERADPSGNDRPLLVLLTGEQSAYDGNLQGLYLGYRPNRDLFLDNGGSNVYSNDGQILWRKLT